MKGEAPGAEVLIELGFCEVCFSGKGTVHLKLHNKLPETHRKNAMI